jgi:hypothetical protein
MEVGDVKFTRVCAVLTLILLATYYGLRAAASHCSGAPCDAYIPWSLLIPLVIVLMGGVTGFAAVVAARSAARGTRNEAARRGQMMWAWLLGILTGIGVLGPFVGLALLRDHPDAFVLTFTVLSLLVPVGALIYSFSVAGSAGRPAVP